MEPSSDVREVARRYLLDELPAAERDLFEGRYLADEELFGRVAQAEAELLDDWAAGRLSAEQSRRLEERYSRNEEGRFRLAFARALAERAAPELVASPVEPAPVGWKLRRLWAHPAVWAAALLALLAVAAGIWLPRPPEGAGTPTEWARGARPTAASAVRGIPLLRLAPGLRRNGGSTAEVALPAGSARPAFLELRLDAPAAGPYQATLETAEGRRLEQRRGLAATGSGAAGAGLEVTLRLDTRQLPPGNYVLTLTPESPGEVPAEYFFRVLAGTPDAAVP